MICSENLSIGPESKSKQTKLADLPESRGLGITRLSNFPTFGENIHKNECVGIFTHKKCATLEKSSYTWPHCKNEMGSKGKITEKIAQPFCNPFDYTGYR